MTSRVATRSEKERFVNGKCFDTSVTPAPISDTLPTFNLLLTIESLVEEFISRFTKLFAHKLGLTRSQIHAHAEN